MNCHRDVYSLSHFTFFLKSTGQYLDGTLGVLPDLISLGVFLKCLEDTSEEACDADGVYVVLQNQRWGGRDLRTDGRSFDHKLHSSIKWWAVCTVLDVSEQRIASSFGVKMKAIGYFETSGHTYPATWSHTRKNLTFLSLPCFAKFQHLSLT